MIKPLNPSSYYIAFSIKKKVDINIMLKNCLKSAMWNIEDLTTDKINDPHFLKTISQFSIIGFEETWTNDTDSIFNITGFHFVDGSNRKNIGKLGVILGALTFLSITLFLKE
jgi:hypothetical protein